MRDPPADTPLVPNGTPFGSCRSRRPAPWPKVHFSAIRGLLPQPLWDPASLYQPASARTAVGLGCSMPRSPGCTPKALGMSPTSSRAAGRTTLFGPRVADRCRRTGLTMDRRRAEYRGPDRRGERSAPARTSSTWPSSPSRTCAEPASGSGSAGWIRRWPTSSPRCTGRSERATRRRTGCGWSRRCGTSGTCGATTAAGRQWLDASARRGTAERRRAAGPRRSRRPGNSRTCSATTRPRPSGWTPPGSIFADLGDALGVATVLQSLGCVAREQGDYAAQPRAAHRERASAGARRRTRTGWPGRPTTSASWPGWRVTRSGPASRASARSPSSAPRVTAKGSPGRCSIQGAAAAYAGDLPAADAAAR